jgi:multiple sugar transport system substrate-binding protein
LRDVDGDSDSAGPMRIKRPKTGGFAMASDQGNQSSACPVDRRSFLKGAGGVAALGVAGALGPFYQPATAQADLRKQILKIPGVGNGSPTDADWQKVGELCLGPTKSNVTAGEFKGVELTFMGLNNQNLHNLLFRGFLRRWETYTGAKIS